MKAFKTLQLEGKTETLQKNIVEFVKPLEDNPLLNGVLVEATIGTSDTLVNHLLQRIPLGFLIADQNANTNIWRTADFNATNLTLRAGASVSVKLWVF